MTSRAQNIAVGLTVAVGILLLGAIIMLFAAAPEWFRGGYLVTVEMSDAGLLKAGDDVTLAGVIVGKVSDVRFTAGDPRRGVKVQIHVDKGYEVPSNATAYVSHGLMGGSAVTLRPEGPLKGGQPFLPRDGSAVIAGVSGTENILDEFRPAIQNIGELAKTVNDMLAAPPEEGPDTQGAGQSATSAATSRPTLMTLLQKTLNNLNKTLMDFQAVAGDPQSQQDLKVTLANLRVVSGQAKEAMVSFQAFAAEARAAVGNINQATTRASGHIDVLAQKLFQDAEDVSAVLTNLNKGIDKMSTGSGTMGKLLNDPHLYNNLVDVTNQLSELMTDLRQLTKEWKDKGIPVRAK